MLVARGLVRRFGAVTAVGGVDLEVEPGEVVGLLGPNGAGKSTTFRMLVGLERPDAGTVLLDGTDITGEPLYARARRGLGYLPQGASVLPRLSARDNLVVALQAVARPASDASELLEDAGLAEVANRRAGDLSGGERRRLEIARCLALRPRVVLLDEPFAGVDPANLRAVATRIRGLAASGIGVLLTDHNVREALSTCDRAAVLDAGIVQTSGTPSEVAADPRVRARYLGHDFCLEPSPDPLQGERGVAYNETASG